MFLELDLAEAQEVLYALTARLRVIGDVDPKKLKCRSGCVVQQTVSGARCRAVAGRIVEQLLTTPEPVEERVAGKHESGSGV